MYRIIVVDDEVNAIEGLKILIDKERNQISEILTATNAMDALKVIASSRPDIIISDISMPQMTGLEMIAQIKAIKNYNPMIIILSGYSTFTYAQQAMSHGVKAYLLKPVDEDELNDKIDELIGEIETSKQLVFEKNIVLYGVIQKIINGDKSAKNIDKLTELLAIENSSNVVVSLSNLSYKSGREVELSDEDIDNDFEKIKAIMDDLINNSFSNSSFLINNELALNISYGCDLTASSVASAFTHINDEVDRKLSIKISNIYSDNISSKEQITDSILNIVAINEKELCHDDEEIDEQFSSQDFKDINTIFTNISNNFDTMFKEELTKNLELAFSMSVEKNIPRSHFASIANAFLVNLTKFIGDAYADVNKVVAGGSAILENNSTLDGAKPHYIEYVLKLHDVMNEYASKLQNETFHNIITYVNNNFVENLTLKSLASKFYVNPIYLGRIFKKKTGTLFNEYLTELRIEKSKLLLKKTNRKIYEIASEIGFNDPNYFIAKFLKSEGVTPSQFRKKG